MFLYKNRGENNQEKIFEEKLTDFSTTICFSLK